jgi:TusA-related sulfurtransferase
MEKHKIKIGKINLENDNFIIISENRQEFFGKIIKGSVNFKVYNETNQEVDISNLEEGDIIKIYTNKKIQKSDLKKLNAVSTNQNMNNDSKNNSIINKILIKNKYVFNSDSSEEWDNLG